MRTAAILLTLSTFLNADLIPLDSQYGPETITLDTNTGLRWLDADLTAGRTGLDVAESFPAWRYATFEEVDGLFLGISESASPAELEALELISLIGDIGTGNFEEIGFGGWFATGNAELSVNDHVDRSRWWIIDRRRTPPGRDEIADPWRAHLLVRDPIVIPEPVFGSRRFAVVPEPQAAALLLLIVLYRRIA